MSLSSQRGVELPASAGSYVLVMQAAGVVSPLIGRLGRRALAAGWYLYVGSARGPGGIAARCGRHLRNNKGLRWHVDYLLAVLKLREIWYRCHPGTLEHDWARALLARPGFQNAWPHFGATDCRCASHLLYAAQRPRFADAASIFGDCGPDRLMQRG